MTVPANKPSLPVAVRLRRLPHNPDLPLPERASEGASGYDLRAALPAAEGGELTLAPGARVLVPTGLALEMPSGLEAQVRPRSGLALRHGVTVLNAPGTVDSDYRGEVNVLLGNLGPDPFVIRRGDRIAQLVFARVESVVWNLRQDLAGSRRGTAGFGSTGID